MKYKFQIMIMALFFMPMVALGVLYLTNGLEVKELPVYGEVPYFSLTERNDVTVDKNALQNKVWIANFIFTHCAGQCPGIVMAAQQVQKALRFKEPFRLVSISMDPERDTPDVFKAYATRVSADPFKWLFLTGDKTEIQKLVKDGFHLAAVEGIDEGDNVTHSSKLVLVDGVGRIRGYYDAEDDAQVKRLIKDAKGLIRGIL